MVFLHLGFKMWELFSFLFSFKMMLLSSHPVLVFSLSSTQLLWNLFWADFSHTHTPQRKCSLTALAVGRNGAHFCWGGSTRNHHLRVVWGHFPRTLEGANIFYPHPISCAASFVAFLFLVVTHCSAILQFLSCPTKQGFSLNSLPPPPHHLITQNQS